MERIEPTRAIALKVWWAYTWRMLVIILAAFVATAILIILFSMLVRLSDGGIRVLGAFIQLGFFLATVALSVEAMLRVLKMKFDDFEIALLPRED